MSYICSACVGDAFLSQLVSKSANEENWCEYCDNESPAVEIAFIADKCDDAIGTFFEVSSLTDAVIHFNRSPAGESLEELVGRLTSMPSDAVEAVVEELMLQWRCFDTSEERYGDDPHFISRHDVDSPMFADWAEIEDSLRAEARYLNPKVSRFMEDLFGGLANHVETGGKSVIADAGPGTSNTELYRARAFETEKDLEMALQHPEKNLGAPPAALSKKAGRMNAMGQPAFYGAADKHTAVAEIRPPVGSWVAIAKFRIIRPLKLLDLRLLQAAQVRKESSLFDPATIANAHKISFLRKLAEVMAMPVLPEQEARDYLITQVVADHLAMLTDVSIDGMIYRSVQRESSSDADGINVVLFHKAATEKRANYEKPTACAALRVYIDKAPGSYIDPAIKFFNEDEKPQPWRLPGYRPQPALELVQDGISLHKITGVSFVWDVKEVALTSDDPTRRGM